MTAPAAPRSRRERPAKPALSREGVVAAALAILREEGLAKVTMRRIAVALDTGPASLYVYVRDTEDLHAQVLDELLAEVDPTGRPRRGAWRPRLRRLLHAYVEVLVRYPELARMAMSTQPSGPHYLAVVDAVVGLLLTGGASDRAAARGVDVLLQVATATVVEHAGHGARDEARELAGLAARIEAGGPGRYPHLTRLGGLLTAGPGDERLDWAFDVVIDGVLAAG